jgi:hypothetical protein
MLVARSAAFVQEAGGRLSQDAERYGSMLTWIVGIADF